MRSSPSCFQKQWINLVQIQREHKVDLGITRKSNILYLILIILMDKRKSLKSLQVQNMEDLYLDFLRKQHRQKVTCLHIDSRTYYVSLAKKLDIVFHDLCQLIVQQHPDKGFRMGFALYSDGFPHFDGVKPLFEDKIPFSQITHIKKDKEYLCFLIRGKQKPMKFKFEQKKTIFKWIELICEIQNWRNEYKNIQRQEDNIRATVYYEVDKQFNPSQFIQKPGNIMESKESRVDRTNKLVMINQSSAEEKLKSSEQRKSEDKGPNFTLSTEIKQKNKQIAYLMQVNDKLKQKHEALQQHLKQFIDTIPKDLTKKDEQISRLRIVVKGLNSEESSSTGINSVRAEDKTLQEKISQLNQQKFNLTQSLRAITLQKADQIRQLKLNIEQIKEEKQETDKIKYNEHCLLQKLKVFQNTVSTVSEENSQLKQRIKKTEQENDKLRKQLKIFIDQGDVRENVQATQYQHHQQALKKIQEENVRLEKNVGQLQTQLREVKQKLVREGQLKLQDQESKFKEFYSLQLNKKDEDIRKHREEYQTIQRNAKVITENLEEKAGIINKLEEENTKWSQEQLKSESLNQKSQQCVMALEIELIMQRLSCEVQKSQLLQKVQMMTNKLKEGVQMEEQYLKMKQSYSMLEEEIFSLKRKLNQTAYRMFFHGDILQNVSQHKLFLKDQVQGYTKKSIAKTQLIFFADSQNTTSFHKYIDDIPDIVLVVKTEDGLYLGGYSQSSLSSKILAEQRGLIMSITNKKVFPLYEGKRSVTYDNFFLIFGNSQIRLKHGEWKVFCNFGIANGFYNAKGGSADDLLGAGKEREVKIVGYQVHRVTFE